MKTRLWLVTLPSDFAEPVRKALAEALSATVGVETPSNGQSPVGSVLEIDLEKLSEGQKDRVAEVLKKRAIAKWEFLAQ